MSEVVVHGMMLVPSEPETLLFCSCGESFDTMDKFKAHIAQLKAMR